MPLNSCLAFIRKPKYVGNKTKKGANLKTDVTRKQSMPNFPKNEHFLPSDTHTCVCVSGVRNVYFRKNLCALFCWNNFFEICPFTLLQANIHTTFPFQL